jgi:hypothetical protein
MWKVRVVDGVRGLGFRGSGLDLRWRGRNALRGWRRL